jgi:hypothetical protein
MKRRLISRHLVLAVLAEAIAIWLFIDSGTWISGQQRYTILFERLFDTPESAASQMRWVQGIAAVVFGCASIGGLLFLERRAVRRKHSDETQNSDSKRVL